MDAAPLSAAAAHDSALATAPHGLSLVTVRDRLAAEYRAEAGELTSTMDDTTLTVTSTGTAEADWERHLRRAVIPAKRDAVLSLRHAERIDDVVFRRMQARLDTEELRLADVIDQDV